MIAYNKGIVLE